MYVDFRKAFDTVDHNILLNKLKSLNLSSHALKLFNSYLSHRTQQVSANKVLSLPSPIITGVPQGSTLGPLLFIIDINNLPCILKNSNSLLFADDTVIFHPSNNFGHSYDCLQQDLASLHLWFEECKQDQGHVLFL